MKSGRIEKVTPDGEGAVVRDSEGREYAVTDASDVPLGETVLFELEDVRVGNEVVTQIAKIKS